MTLGKILERNAQQYPEKTAISYRDRDISFSELDEMANRLANGLLNLGLEKTFKVADSATVSLFGEAHNITNNRTTLQVNPQLGPNQGDVQRILDPGVFQFGVRVSF